MKVQIVLGVNEYSNAGILVQVDHVAMSIKGNPALNVPEIQTQNDKMAAACAALRTAINSHCIQHK